MVPDDFRPADNSPASRELDRRSRQQADVARLGVLALSGVPISDLIGEALRSIRSHLGVAFAGVIRMEGESAQLIAADGFLPHTDALAIAPGSLAALLRATGGPIVVPDLSQETRFQSSLLESMGAKSGIAVPLRAGGGTIGGLAAGDLQTREYPVEDADFLQSVANVVSAAVLRSRQDDELRRSQNRWRTLVETANQGVWTIDSAGRVDYLNARMAELLGLPPDQVLGRKFLRFLTPAERRNPRWRLSSDPSVRDTIEVEIERADGRALRVLMSRSSLVDDHGKQQGSLGIITDITARTEAEESVAASERYFRSLIENSLDCVAIIDAANKYTYVSPNVRTLLGYQPEELLQGRSPFDFLHPDDLRTATSCVEQATVAPGEVSFARVRFRHKDGTWRWIDASVRNLLHDPIVRGLVVNWHDVTERYQAEQALRQSEEKLRQAQKIEAIGRLAGGIAHDFNNLLTAILTTAQLATMEVPEDSPLRGDLGEIHQAAERAAGLTRQLLAFSRRQVLRPRIVDVALVVSDLEKMLVRLIGEDVELVSHNETNCNVRADPGQLEQVIMNLALNARDAMPGGGRLTLRTGKVDLDVEDGHRMFGCPVSRGSYVRLQVEDTGLGMDETTLQHIFEPFFTTKEMGKGTGLGLATVYGIVKQSGGYIRATSRVGAGSTFEIFLPETSEMADAPQQRLPSMGTGKGETVLLVEDEELVRVAARKALLRSGFHVLEANNGVHALKIYGLTRVDLVITDLIMPEMGGRELATRLRQHNPDVKVLFTSGYTDDPTIRGGETARGIAFLPKPFTPDSLGRKAREVLDQPRDS